MSEKRKVILAADLVVEHGDKIKELKDKGATIEYLKNKYKCSRNTMSVALVKLGYDAPEWMKKKQ